VFVPNAFHFAGIKTNYNDIELDTYGLDADQFASKVTDKIKAVMLHHLYELVCQDYEKILEIARKHGIFMIEDCAHALENGIRILKLAKLVRKVSWPKWEGAIHDC